MRLVTRKIMHKLLLTNENTDNDMGFGATEKDLGYISRQLTDDL